VPQIGKNCKIWIKDLPEDIIIGDNVTVGRETHLDRDVVIGNNTSIQGCVYIPPKTRIGSNVFIGPGVTITNDKYPPSKRIEGVTIHDGAIIGAHSCILAGVVIGVHAVVGMGSVVLRNVPDSVIVFGNPARPQPYRWSDYCEKQKQYEQI